MDALDEFFRDWCEPEAWCERCAAHPAVHVVIHDDKEPYGSIITFVRIWDPDMQTHIAVCRQCSARHIETLGTLSFQYASEQNDAAKRSRQLTPWELLWRHLQRWQRRIARHFGWDQHRSQKRRDQQRYSRTEM